MQTANEIFKAIEADPQNQEFTEQGVEPLYHINPNAEILIISQAPSRKAQESMVFFGTTRAVTDYVIGWGLRRISFTIQEKLPLCH